MSIDHEAVLQGLIDQIAVGCGSNFKHYSRRLKFWTDSQVQPALFLRHTGDEDDWPGEGLGIVTLEGELWLYCKASQDPSEAPDTELNRLVKLVRAVFEPDADGEDARFTIGGIVYRCRIDGKSLFDPGDTDEQSKALLPIKIMLP